MHRFLGLLALALVVGLVPAMADLTPVDGLLQGDSWGQRFVGDVGSYNLLEIQHVSGSLFEPPAFRNFSNNTGVWTAGGTGNLSWATSGTAQSNVQFDIIFVDPRVNPTVFDFWAVNGHSVVDSARATYNGGWSFAAIPQADDDPPAVPEPTSLLLLGMMGPLVLGVPKLLTRS